MTTQTATSPPEPTAELLRGNSLGAQARLGTQADPFLDFLLRQFSEQVLRLDAEGRQGVSLLYQAWVEAGLAREGYEGRVTLWQDGAVRTELRLADAAVPAERVAQLLEAARMAEEPRLERVTNVPGLHYLLVVPLTAGSGTMNDALLSLNMSMSSSSTSNGITENSTGTSVFSGNRE